MLTQRYLNSHNIISLTEPVVHNESRDILMQNLGRSASLVLPFLYTSILLFIYNETLEVACFGIVYYKLIVNGQLKL